ncbi:hypothetical protein Tco_0794749 [Tanacetum coccineum]
MATEKNDVRRTTIRRLRQELVTDVESAKNLLFELNRYLNQMRSHGPEVLRVESLPDHPLIKYGFNTLEKATHTDITNSSNLVAARNALLQTIDVKEEMINHYRTIFGLPLLLKLSTTRALTLLTSADYGLLLTRPNHLNRPSLILLMIIPETSTISSEKIKHHGMSSWIPLDSSSKIKANRIANVDP